MRFGISILCVIFSLCVFGQQQLINRKQYIDSTIQVNNKNIPLKNTEHYFPLIFFQRFKLTTTPLDSSYFFMYTYRIDGKDIKYYSKAIDREYDTSYVKWFSKHLLALEEPLLFNTVSEKEVYRFTWLRTFDNPISIRIEKSEKTIWLHTKVCNGAGGYAPGRLKTNRKKKIKKEEWEKFEKIIKQLDYWNLEYRGNIPGNDGAQWILEGSTKEQYSILFKQSPNKKSDYYMACNYLIELSGLKIKERNKY